MCGFGNYKAAATGGGCSGISAGEVASLSAKDTCTGTDVSYSSDPYVCHACPPGYDCSPLAFVATECDAGSYADGSGASCADCTSGNYCPSRTTASSTSCPTGTYQPNGKQTECIACPKDNSCSTTTASPCNGSTQYSPLGDSNCYTCDPGYDCTGDTPVPCDPGYYHTGGGNSCSICDTGNECPDPTASPVPCGAGYYADGQGFFKCKLCPPGYMCPGGSTITQCSGGSYQHEAGQDHCETYAEGTERNDANNDAKPQGCPVGYYTTSSGS